MLEQAAALLRRGMSPLPVPYGQKSPNLTGWPDLRLTEETLPEHFNGRPSNVGVLLGDASDGLVDVDCDIREAVVLARVFLPQTVTFGRRSNPASHWLFRVGDPLKTEKFRDPTLSEDERSMVAELRSTGAQTLFPPSTHPSGEVIAWDRDGEPTCVAAGELRARVARLAAAALLARHWPGTGSRQDAALALAGGLLRAGWSEPDAASFIHAIAECAGDEEAAKRQATVRDTARRIEVGKQGTGWPTLARLIPSPVVTRAREWLDLRGNDEPEVAPPLPTDAVEPFPIEVLPEILGRFVGEVADALPAPPDLVAVPLLAVLGAAVGTSRRLEVKPGWYERPCIYSAVVAEPGSKKSPALGLAQGPAHERQRELERDYQARKAQFEEDQVVYERELADWRAAVKKGEAGEPPRKPEPPVMAQVYTTDATLEALAQLLHQNPRGLVFIRDELTGWARSMDQYRGGKGADRQTWLSIWSGSSIVVNRRSQREPLLIPHPLVNVTGCLPPEVLGDLADDRARQDGFVHRILFAFPDPVAIDWTESSVSETALAGYDAVFRALSDLQPATDPFGQTFPQTVRFTPAGKRKFVEWARSHYAEQRVPDFRDELRGPFAKLEGYAARLALILHLCRFAAGEVETEDVDEYSILGAAALIDYFKSHAARVYAQLHTTPEDRRVQQAITWIRKQGGSVTAREAMRARVARVTRKSEVDQLFRELEDRGYGRGVPGDRNSLRFELFPERQFLEPDRHSTGNDS